MENKLFLGVPKLKHFRVSYILAEFHKTDLGISGQSRDGKVPI